MVGLALARWPRIGRLGLVGAAACAYSFVYFTGTVIYALGLGSAVVRTGVYPRWPASRWWSGSASSRRGCRTRPASWRPASGTSRSSAWGRHSWPRLRRCAREGDHTERSGRSGPRGRVRERQGLLRRHQDPEDRVDQDLAARDDHEQQHEQQPRDPRPMPKRRPRPAHTPPSSRPSRGRTRPCAARLWWMSFMRRTSFESVSGCLPVHSTTVRRTGTQVHQVQPWLDPETGSREGRRTTWEGCAG